MMLTPEDLRELMALRAQILAYRERERMALEMGEHITANMSQAPTYTGPGDPVGNAGATAADIAAEAEQALMEISGRVWEIEREISRIGDEMVKACVMLHFDCGLTWEQTAKKIGGGNSADSCRKRVERFFTGGEV